MWEVETFGLEGMQLIEHEEFTCYVCAWNCFVGGNKMTCEFRWDLYNTPLWDCLAEK